MQSGKYPYRMYCFSRVEAASRSSGIALPS
jgi:hypothetical protein